MLTPASFFVDATHTLLGTALRITPFCQGSLRLARDLLTAEILSAESESEGPADAAAEQAVLARMQMALLNARDGRLNDALDAMSRLAAEHSGDTLARLYAAGLCHVLGRHQDGARWLRDAAVPNLSRLELKIPFVEAILFSTLGSAPRAVAGSEELVLATTLGLVEMSMWSSF